MWRERRVSGHARQEMQPNPAKSALDPAFWGIEQRSAGRILKELAGAGKPRPTPLPREKRHPQFVNNTHYGGLIDPSLRPSTFANEEAAAEMQARWGLAYDAATFAAQSLRPIVPSGAMTPAARRMLLAQGPDRTAAHRRSHSTEPSSAGGMLGMMTLRRSAEALPPGSWRAVFTESTNMSAQRLANPSQDDLRQEHSTGLVVRAGKRFSKRLTAPRLDPLSSTKLDPNTSILAGTEVWHVGAFETHISALCAQLRYPEAVGSLTNLRIIRHFASQGMGEGGLLSLLRVMNRTCTELEEAARREPDAAGGSTNAVRRLRSTDEGDNNNTLYWLERLRQHRRFVLDDNEAFQRRPQAVVERALLLKTSLPIVFRNATKAVKAAEKDIEELLAKVEEVKGGSKHSHAAAVKLAALKRSVRELWLDGSLQTSLSDPIQAAKFRVLVAEVGQRIILVRSALMQEGIPVEEDTLHELLRSDESFFPSNLDRDLSKKAVAEAKAALEDLQSALARDQKLEDSERQARRAETEKLRAEETELKKIEESEQKMESDRNALKSKYDKKFVTAISQFLNWDGPCGGSLGKGFGGDVAIYGSQLYVVSDDTDITVYDTKSSVFDFCQKYTLGGGHSRTVTCLAVLNGHTLFSGGMDHRICVWDVELDFCLEQVLEGHTETVSCMAIADTNPKSKELDVKICKGKFLVSGSYDMTVRVWESEDPELTAILNRHSRPQSQATHSRPNQREMMLQQTPEGSSVLIGEGGDRGDGNDPTAAAPSGLMKSDQDSAQNGRDRIRWHCKRVLTGHGCFVQKIVTEGNIAYSSGEDGLIKVWDVFKRHSIGQLEGCEETIYGLCLRKDAAGERSAKPKLELLSAGIEHVIKAWDLKHPKLVQEGIVTMEDATIFSLAPDSILHDVHDELTKLEHDMSVAITEDGKKLLQLGIDACQERLKALTQWQGTLQYVKSLCYRDNFIYSGGGEDVIRVWDVDLRACVGTITGLKGIHSMAIDTENDILSVCSRDNRVRLLGTPESCSAFSASKKEREENFSRNGGELWLFDLVKDSARLLLPEIRIRQVACGEQHGIALDHTGHAWSWGSSSRGQCGQSTKENVSTPRRIDYISGGVSIEGDNHKVKSVAAGWFHSILLMEAGTAYACGENDMGQFSLPQSDESVVLLKELQEEIARAETLSDGLDKDNALRKIAEISGAYAVANFVYVPKQVFLTKEGAASGTEPLSITAVAAAGRHSIFVDESGAAWSCGLATHGQLGVKRDLHTPLPTKDGYHVRELHLMDNLESVTVVAAAASARHTLLLTSQGRVFACGDNSAGQLGHGDISGMPAAEGQCLLAPSLVLALRQIKVTSCAAGFGHSMFVTQIGGEAVVYACGVRGATGLPENTHVPQALPPCRSEGGQKAIKDVTVSPGGVSGDYSYITTDDGHVFIAGAVPEVVPQTGKAVLKKTDNQKSGTEESDLGTGGETGESQNLDGNGHPGENNPVPLQRMRTPYVPPVYASANGAPWKLGPVRPVGLVPIHAIAKFGGEVPGVQSLHEMAVVVEPSCVAFHPSCRGKGVPVFHESAE